MIRTLLIGAASLLLLSATATFAQVRSVLTPFVADVPVSSQALGKRGAAAELGLLDVLVRVSGSEDIRYNDDILTKTSDAIRYVEQFEYLELDEKLDDPRYTSILRMHFSERLVKRLLSETGQKFWSLNRPPVLVWLVEDSLSHGKQMLNDTHESALVEGLLEGARYRGIQLAFPLLDFQDQVALGAQKLWALDDNAILDASERYQPEVILVGKFTTISSGQLWSNWEFFYKGDSRVYDLKGEDQFQAGKDAVNPVADYLAKTFAVKLSAGDTDYYYARISNIQSFGDYKNLMQALTSIDAIGNIVLDSISGDVLNLRFKSEASANQLRDLIGLNKGLSARALGEQSHLPAWQRSQPGSREYPLNYYWGK